jgi:hypothetical protein
MFSTAARSLSWKRGYKIGMKGLPFSTIIAGFVIWGATTGLIHGRSVIQVADPERTNIIGNFRMTYGFRQINCNNYSWLVRILNRPHHEIENDPRVWGQIASLIDSELSSTSSIARATATPQ